MIASEALQRALYARLSADAPLMARLTGLHDQVPTGAAFPYLVFEAAREAEESTRATRVAEVRLTLAVYSRHTGRQEALAVLARLGELLDMPLAPTGWHPVFVRPLAAQVRAMPNDNGWRAELSLAALLERTA